MWCDNLTILTKIEAFRFVGYCQHDTFHIAWDYLMLHLQASDFKRLVKCLEQGLTTVQLGEIEDKGFCRIVQQENGYYQVWLGDILIFLTTAEFLKFANLLRRASQKMGRWASPIAVL